MTHFIDVQTSTVKVKKGSITREVPRKAEDQQLNYLNLFDFDTLFADIYHTRDKIEFLGPPLVNLKEYILKGKVLINGRNTVDSIEIFEKHRITRALLDNINNKLDSNNFINIDNQLVSQSLLVQPNLSSFFKDRNVLVTQQKNNSLHWIAYWIAFHIKYHEIDSVIIYDNNSDMYTLEELKYVIDLFPEIKVASVVAWDIPWGPTGGHNSIWDSDFGQHQSFEHAFSRLLLEANCVIFGDIDEFPISEKGFTIPQVISMIDEPVLSYKRRQIVEVNLENYTDYGIRLPSDTGYYEPEKAEIAPKYAINPKKLSNQINLMAHQVIGAKQFNSKDIISRHIGCMKMDWRNERFEAIKLKSANDFPNLVEDIGLKEALHKLQLDWLNKLSV